MPPQAKSQQKHTQFAHPMPSPSVGNTTHGVGHHRPKAVVAAPMGGPRSPSRPPTCNAHKNNIRGNKLSEATCFCPYCGSANRTAGACVASSPDSDLEAFSQNPAHGSFAPLAFQPSAMTNCANQRFLSY
ncbi:hypothetical protein M0R45_007185 [Rubus argutus]|uniref:Uncharacterized protein n=1 Tax=Rubus argutus TaxID=59490 RepID=A0AAW1YUK9_RUBAR